MTETTKPDAATARAERAYLARGRYRFRLACLAFALAFLLIGGRLVTLGFTGMGQGAGGLYDISSTVHRPDILDRHGRLLATDIKGATLYADPAKVIDIDELAEQVTSVLTDVDAKTLRAKLRAGGRFVRIKRELTPKQQEEIHELGLPGLAFIEEYRRVYPMGATASHVVGLVDVDNKGLAGIEKFIDDNPQLTMSDDQAVTISLDLGAQHVMREELSKAIKVYHAKAAAGIVIDVHSGEVLALASLPDYDPNRREQALDKDRLNRIGFGVYEMGSVFKVFTVAGVLDMGLASMRSHYDASSPIHYASFTIDDFHGQHRSLSVPEVFIYSSNIGAAKMALEMGVDRHRAFLKKLGLMSRVSTEIGDSAAPIIPTHWQKLNTMTIAFGHGMSVTPIQLAASTLPLVNGGIAVAPTFLPRSREDGMAGGSRVLKSETSSAMLKLMRLNVLKGTGKRANAEGYRVGGKTGTAEKVVGGHYSTSTLLTSFLVDLPDRCARNISSSSCSTSRSAWPSRATRRRPASTPRPPSGKIIERIAPILGVAPRLEDDQRKFDAKVLASY